MDMKNTYKYIPAMLLAVAAISCNTLEKDEVEASFTPKGSLPTVSDVKLISVDEYAGEAVVEATFSGITSDMENLEIGFVASDEVHIWYVALRMALTRVRYRYRPACRTTSLPWLHAMTGQYIPANSLSMYRMCLGSIR